PHGCPGPAGPSTRTDRSSSIAPAWQSACSPLQSFHCYFPAMNRSSKLLWLAFAILVPLGLLWQFYPLRDASARLNAFPMTSPKVDSKDLPLTPAELAVYSNI